MARRKGLKCPYYAQLIEPVFKALVELAGSGSIDEISEKVISLMNLSDEVVDEPHTGKAGERTELDYQLAWARTYLKKYGAITNRSRGVWMIMPDFANQTDIDADLVVKTVKEELNKSDDSGENTDASEFADEDPENDGLEVPDELASWRIELSEMLHSMNPYAFERLTVLMLRESGFSHVNVTKKSRDGGIDGTGELLINGIFSFNVAFQCKRYSGVVSARDIRDFRGSLTADERGVFITTGTFTSEARKEASLAGKLQKIDLIDGEEFIDKLLELGIGVNEKTISIYEVDKDFFENI